MLKRILVPTDGSESAGVGMRYAIALAKQYQAKLLGIHVVDVKLLEGPFLRDLSASLGTAPYVNYQGNIAALLDERGKAALNVFKTACEDAAVECDTSLVTGIVPRAIVDAGNLADLIVMGRGGEHNEWLEGLVGSTTAAVVRRAPQPVLVTGNDTPGRTRFLVAYDGSAHAQRALRTAANIAVDWQMPFDLLVVGNAEEQAIVDEARAYLAAHPVEADYVLLGGEPADVIVEYAAERKADLLVMGAFGHSRMHEWVVGSTTSFAINHAPCPVLLAR